jgi:transcription termination factor NusB
MWTSQQRIILFLVIYNYEYLLKYLDYDLSNEVNIIDRIFDIYLTTTYKPVVFGEEPLLTGEEEKKYEEIFNQHILDRVSFKEKLEVYVKSWDKTSLIILVLLFCISQEIKDLGGVSKVDEDSKKLIIRAYIKLCQSYVDNEAVAFLHAILTKYLS